MVQMMNKILNNMSKKDQAIDYEEVKCEIQKQIMPKYILALLNGGKGNEPVLTG